MGHLRFYETFHKGQCVGEGLWHVICEKNFFSTFCVNVLDFLVLALSANVERFSFSRNQDLFLLKSSWGTFLDPEFTECTNGRKQSVKVLNLAKNFITILEFFQKIIFILSDAFQYDMGCLAYFGLDQRDCIVYSENVINIYFVNLFWTSFCEFFKQTSSMTLIIL